MPKIKQKQQQKENDLVKGYLPIEYGVNPLYNFRDWVGRLTKDDRETTVALQ